MADVFSKKFRSEVMRRVRRFETYDEELLYNAIRRHRYRPQRNVKSLPGSPDLVFPRARVAVFVDGDYWHGRAYFRYDIAPATNTAFWIKRFRDNRRRDRRVSRELRVSGWTVLRVWGSDVRRSPEAVARRIVRRLKLARL